MAKLYVSRENDMVDAICWAYYPKRQQALAVEEVFRVNVELSRYDAVLPQGVEIILPDLPKPKTDPIINLWGD